MFLNVETVWWVIFALGLVALTVFIWYFSRGTEWMEENPEDNPRPNPENDWFFDKYGMQ